ncbi:hypothetical protein LXA43DRAFT_1168062 [Ganoderma leucocontextum]|nr:hypothetical protein LXA43DRAFT_1168062 [Ganoderma leucocontextum]
MRFADAIFQPCCQGCSDSGALLPPNGHKLTMDEDGNHYADVPEDTPDIKNVDFYAAAVSTVFHSYKTCLDAAGDYVDMAHRVAKTPTQSVWERAQRGDAASMLELAMRYGSGCEARERLDKAIELLEVILARAGDHSGTPTNVSEHVFQRTLSAAALAFYSKYREKQIAGTLLAYYHDPDLLRAATEADRAVAAGLPSRAALLVAEHLVGLGRTFGVRRGPRTDGRFGGFRALWGAYDTQKKLASKIRESPQQFQCAAEDCDVRTMDKRRLKRCSGSCPPEMKPSYCSKDCQRRDWQSRHKAEGCVSVNDLEGSDE